jgi:hypothetical protein
VELVGEKVIAPALRLTRGRLRQRRGAPGSIRVAAGIFLSQAELLWRHGAIEYMFLRATRPQSPD